MADKFSIPAAVAVLALGALAACGQTGKLYLPDKAGDVVTSPAPTATPNPPPAGETGAPNSPQTVDAPAGAPAAPEVTAPVGTPEAEDPKKEKGATTPPPQ